MRNSSTKVQVVFNFFFENSIVAIGISKVCGTVFDISKCMIYGLIILRLERWI